VAKPPLYTRGFQLLGCLPRLLQLLPAAAKVATGDFHPLKDRALARHTLTCELSNSQARASWRRQRPRPG